MIDNLFESRRGEGSFRFPLLPLGSLKPIFTYDFPLINGFTKKITVVVVVDQYPWEDLSGLPELRNEPKTNFATITSLAPFFYILQTCCCTTRPWSCTWTRSCTSAPWGRTSPCGSGGRRTCWPSSGPRGSGGLARGSSSSKCCKKCHHGKSSILVL